MLTEDEVKAIVTEYVQQDIEKAMPLITGMFVGMIEAYIILNDGDSSKQIVLDGHRKITIGPDQ